MGNRNARLLWRKLWRKATCAGRDRKILFHGTTKRIVPQMAKFFAAFRRKRYILPNNCLNQRLRPIRNAAPKLLLKSRWGARVSFELTERDFLGVVFGTLVPSSDTRKQVTELFTIYPTVAIHASRTPGTARRMASHASGRSRHGRFR